jgi:hypothetical protein
MTPCGANSTRIPRSGRTISNDVEVKVRDQRTDPEIAEDAVQALESQTNVPTRVTVTVRSGLVTLEGAVEWMYQKTAARTLLVVRCRRVTTRALRRKYPDRSHRSRLVGGSLREHGMSCRKPGSLRERPSSNRS